MKTTEQWSIKCPHCGHEIKMEIITTAGRGGSGPPAEMDIKPDSWGTSEVLPPQGSGGAGHPKKS